MGTFNFVIAKFVPDPVRNEPINVGVIVNDSSSGRSCGRFIENFRILAGRYPDSNVAALKTILASYRGRYPTKDGYLTKLSKESAFQLRFTGPNAIRSDALQTAADTLFEKYISIQPRAAKPQALTKT